MCSLLFFCCVCVCACVLFLLNTPPCQQLKAPTASTNTVLPSRVSCGPAHSSQLEFDSQGRISSNGPEHLFYRLGNAALKQTTWFINKTPSSLHRKHAVHIEADVKTNRVPRLMSQKLMSGTFTATTFEQSGAGGRVGLDLRECLSLFLSPLRLRSSGKQDLKSVLFLRGVARDSPATRSVGACRAMWKTRCGVAGFSGLGCSMGPKYS